MTGTWTTLGTKTAGQVVGASTDWNPLVNDVLWLGGQRPDCKVRLSTAQVVGGQTESLIQWNADVWDDWNMHNTGANLSRLVVPVAGRYLFTMALRMDSTTFDYYMQLRHNGNAVEDGLDTRKAGRAVNVTDWGDQLSVPLDCAVGDYLEGSFWHSLSVGVTLNVRVNSWARLVWEGA